MYAGLGPGSQNGNPGKSNPESPVNLMETQPDRPIVVTIFAWFEIAGGVVIPSLVFALTFNSPFVRVDWLAVIGATALQLAFGFGLLTGKNWARWPSSG